ncbi:MAG TPA: VWA domain-containing protein [Burkholderiales bacterium]|jgi:Mg-chelatase subunit ChlD|nr:VWA domain-containing protein [Burkholderiales bacterium]
MPTVTVATHWPLALLAALPLVWLLALRHSASVGRARVASATVLRSFALAAIVVALLKPTLHRASEDVSVVYVLDVSGSVAPRFLDEALDWIAQVNAHYQPAQSRVVAFADHAELVDTVDAVRALALTAEDGHGRGDAIDQGATDLEEGLLAALSGFAPGLAKRIVLLSDGNQTEGDAWQAMLRLQAEGARLFAVPATVAAHNDAWVVRVSVPPGARARAAVEVEARVFSRRSVPARVELAIGERPVAVRSVTLSPGDNRVSFTVRFPRAGAQNVTVRVSAEGDELARNDALTEDLMVQPRPHALYVEGGERGARYLADALTAQGIRVSVATAQNLSDDARLLNGKDVVILSDVRADSLGTDAVQRLGAFVRDHGGGLIFAAGQNTYGQEGFAKSEVERLLPVTFEAKRKHEDLDLVLLVDRSSSMRGQKIEVSKSAALATLDLLDQEHRLAVVAFDAQPHDVVPLMTVGNKREAEDLISRMISSGQTNIYNALLRAQALLAESEAKTKHIILLSDGLTSPPPGVSPAAFYPTEIEERLREVQAAEARQRGGAAEPPRSPQVTASPRGFPGIMEELVDAKITMSTVAIGEKPDVELMANLANWGGGRSYLTRSDAEVPTLFAAETRRLLNDSIVEERFRPRVNAWSPTLAGVDFAGGPELKGYVTTKPKRFSNVLLEAKKDLPLLAETHYGLGKTVAFLSDVKNRWAADWLGWPGYARLWSQVVRDSARRDTGAGLNWKVTREGREAFIHLTALGNGGSFRNGLWPKVRITTPGGQGSVAALRQVAPGQYRAQIPLATAGSVPWRFELLPGPGLSAADIARVGSRRLFYSYPDEYRLLPANLPLLRTLSEQTGGVFAPRAEEIFTLRGDSGVTHTPLWPHCVGAALLLFLLDILVRRAPWRLRRAL